MQGKWQVFLFYLFKSLIFLLKVFGITHRDCKIPKSVKKKKRLRLLTGELNKNTNQSHEMQLFERSVYR